jgi:ribonuclease HI
MNVEVYTDGSATTSNKPGGYGYVLVINGTKHSEGLGPLKNATNNDAELSAAIEGLKAAYLYIKSETKENQPTDWAKVTLVSDSQIILGWANGSYRFKQTSKYDRFKQLEFLVSKMNVKTRWVEGHTGDIHNERCDYLANMARKSLEEPKENSKKERKQKNKILKNAALQKNINIEDGVIIINYKGILKRIDLTKNTVEDYNKTVE